MSITLSAETCFKLHSTFGLPIDIIKDVAKERGGVLVDEEGFNRLLHEQKNASRRAQGLREKDYIHK